MKSSSSRSEVSPHSGSDELSSQTNEGSAPFTAYHGVRYRWDSIHLAPSTALIPLIKSLMENGDAINRRHPEKLTLLHRLITRLNRLMPSLPSQTQEMPNEMDLVTADLLRITKHNINSTREAIQYLIDNGANLHETTPFYEFLQFLQQEIPAQVLEFQKDLMKDVMETLHNPCYEGDDIKGTSAHLTQLEDEILFCNLSIKRDLLCNFITDSWLKIKNASPYDIINCDDSFEGRLRLFIEQSEVKRVSNRTQTQEQAQMQAEFQKKYNADFGLIFPQHANHPSLNIDWHVEEAFLYYIQSPQFHRQLQNIFMEIAETKRQQTGKVRSDEEAAIKYRYGYSEHARFSYWCLQSVTNVDIIKLIKGAGGFVNSLKDKKCPSRLATSEPCFSETPFQYALRTNPNLALEMDKKPWMDKYWQGSGLKQMLENLRVYLSNAKNKSEAEIAKNKAAEHANNQLEAEDAKEKVAAEVAAAVAAATASFTPQNYDLPSHIPATILNYVKMDNADLINYRAILTGYKTGKNWFKPTYDESPMDGEIKVESIAEESIAEGSIGEGSIGEGSIMDESIVDESIGDESIPDVDISDEQMAQFFTQQCRIKRNYGK